MSAEADAERRGTHCAGEGGVAGCAGSACGAGGTGVAAGLADGRAGVVVFGGTGTLCA